MNDHTLYRTSYDNSMVEAFCRCERRHYFNYVRCIVPERTGLALSFGSAWHEAMDSMWRNWDVEASYQAFLSLWPQEIVETTAYPRTPGNGLSLPPRLPPLIRNTQGPSGSTPGAQCQPIPLHDRRLPPDIVAKGFHAVKEYQQVISKPYSLSL